MGIAQEIYKRIYNEITNDPRGVGYVGKTDAEIAKLLNEPLRKMVQVENVEPPPINVILAGLSMAEEPPAPNAVTEQDVVAAKQLIT